MNSKGILSLLSLLSICTTLLAQEMEYKMDLGGGVGGTFYIGDANGTLYKKMNLMGTLVGRYKFNPRMAIKTNLAVGRVSGNTQGLIFPTQTSSNRIANRVSFANTLIDLGAQYEQNFWGYGTGEGYKGNRRLTPYILLGFGFTYLPTSNVFAANIPLGVGVKYKLRERLNLSLEWSMRFSTTDALDATTAGEIQLDDPYGVKSGTFKNKDCYSFTMLSLTYDMFPKQRKCNN